MEAVNLLPAYARPGRRWATAGTDIPARRVLQYGGIAAGVAAIALGGTYALERHNVNSKRSQLNDATARLTAVEAEAAPLRATQAQAQAQLTSFQAVINSRIPWESVLADLSRVLPSQSYLTSMSITSPTPASALAAPVVPAGTTATATAVAPVPTGGAFSISGVASSHVRVALVLDRLALMPWLSNVTLLGSAHGGGTTGSTPGDSFQVNAGFNAVEAAK